MSMSEDVKRALVLSLPVISRYPLYRPVDDVLSQHLEIAVRVLLKYYRNNNCYVVDPETGESTFDYKPMSDVFEQIGTDTLSTIVSGGVELEQAMVDNLSEYMFHIFNAVGGAENLADIDIIVFSESVKDIGMDAFCHIRG